MIAAIIGLYLLTAIIIAFKIGSTLNFENDPAELVLAMLYAAAWPIGFSLLSGKRRAERATLRKDEDERALSPSPTNPLPERHMNQDNEHE